MKYARATRGFTLIELMITIAVVSILATVGASSYRAYIVRTHRSEALAALLQVRVAQEKFYIQNNAYATNAQLSLAVPNGLGLPATTRPEGRYQLRIRNTNAALDFTVIATPTSGGGQLGDAECQTMTVDQSGARTATDSGGADSSARCWH